MAAGHRFRQRRAGRLKRVKHCGSKLPVAADGARSWLYPERGPIGSGRGSHGNSIARPELRGGNLRVDLSRDLSNAEFDEIKRIWLEHKIAVFRGQEIGDDALVAFTERFSPLFVHSLQFNDQTGNHVDLQHQERWSRSWRTWRWRPDVAFGSGLFRVACLLDLYGIEVPNEGQHLVLVRLAPMRRCPVQ